ncbi:MAG: biopolymer transporter ExbD [Nitrospinota bacterium]|nr:biopolymer transporter ExbD [Nitrospinota bacterium]MDP7169029.1 biopolymer transporter ExbD [Nitrospinota bacterium]MDP7371402.1 biopolymer transporter ExbD [Nitrospinota bacterium]MDP7505617.1 biopolymer transporter ExbD [Nitrospinota bacterium]HJP14756.1 biopolymer transporter ExbD [Nitrospinota bacterium]
MRFASKTEEDYSLQLTSLIDVVFLLLIFFMVSTSFVDFTRRMDILLPQSKKSTEVERVENFLLEVGVEKKLTLNGKDITIDDLERRLMEARRTPGRRTLIIKADKRLDYGFVVRIMGISFSAEIRDISVAVKE